MVSDGSVKYEEADVDRSAIGHFIFFSAKCVMRYLSVRPNILFHVHGPDMVF